MTFTDISESSGIRLGDSIWNTGASFVDINLDGKLDLFVAGYFEYFQRPYLGLVPEEPGKRNKLFINNGDNTFSERGLQYGIDT